MHAAPTPAADAILNAPRDDASTRPLTKYVSFTLANERYALNASRINEVLRHSDITPVPGSAPFILGIINLRGNVVTVVDARAVLGLAYQPPGAQSRIIVVEVEDFIVGILVDQVAAVVDLDTLCIEEAPATGNMAAMRFIQGVYNMDDTLYILVEFDRITELLPH